MYIMEISETERLQILQEKEKIKVISNEIFDIHHDLTNKTEILKRMSQILNHLSSIANYTGSTYDVNNLRRDIYDIEDLWNSDGCENRVRNKIRDFCNDANSITFDFTKSEKKLTIFARIKNFITVNIGNFGKI